MQERVRSGLLGNTEAIEDLGIFVNVKTIEMTDAFKRMADGKSWEQLDAYAQQQIRTMAILEQATDKYGTEVAYTTATVRSQFSAAWQDFQATWGQVVNKVLIPALEVLTQVLDVATRGLQLIFNISGSTIEEADSIDKAAENQKKLTEEIEETNKAQKKSLAGFDEIQKLSAGAETTTAGGGGNGVQIEALPILSADGINKADIIIETIKSKLSEVAIFFKDIWNSEPVQNFVDVASSVLGAFELFVSTIWNNTKTNSLKTWNLIEADVKGTGENLKSLWNGVWSDYSDAIDKWSPTIIEKVNTLLNSIWEDALTPGTVLIASTWEDMTKILSDVWDEYGAPILDRVGQFIDNTLLLFQSLWDNLIAPIVTPLLKELERVWNTSLKGLLKKLSQFIAKLITGALDIYNEFIVPVSKWFLEGFKPIVDFLADIFVPAIGAAIDLAATLAGDIIDALDGVIDFLVGVFTLDWDKAWQGLANIVKGVINTIVDALNFVIDGLNEISFDVPDWVPGIGGKSWNLGFPRIPRLATGAVIPPNREFLAVLGDQKQGMNIEAPLQTIVDAFNIALNNRTDNSNSEAILEIDGEQFGRLIYRLNKQQSRRVGVVFSEV